MGLITKKKAAAYSKFPEYLGKGKHKCRIISLEEFEGATSGNAGIAMVMEILKTDSEAHSVGEEVQIGWIERKHDYGLKDFQTFVKEAFEKDDAYVRDHENLLEVLELDLEGAEIEIEAKVTYTNDKGKEYCSYKYKPLEMEE
jgi:hypothetical protein